MNALTSNGAHRTLLRLDLLSLNSPAGETWTLRLESEILTLTRSGNRVVLKLHRAEVARYLRFTHDPLRGRVVTFVLIQGAKKYSFRCTREQQRVLLGWLPEITSSYLTRQAQLACIGVALFGVLHFLISRSLFWVSFLIGEKFIGNDDVAMILGDNIFVGSGLSDKLSKATENVRNGKATIFGYYVNDPERFGVIEFDKKGKVISLEEKPKVPKSNYAATGLYFYDNNVVEYAKQVKPSWRNELEITDLNNIYLSHNKLEAIALDRGYTWLDAGTPDSLAESTRFIQSLEKHQGLKIACLEEIGYHKGWISRAILEEFIKNYAKSDYGNYLAKVLEGKIIYKN